MNGLGGDMLALLVRHGETDANRGKRFLGRMDPELNETGRQEATELARILGAREVTAAYASPLLRAQQTAAPIAAAHGLGVQEAPALQEMDLGLLDGLPVDEGRMRFPQFFADWRERPAAAQAPEGESLGDVQRRAWALLESAAERHPGDECVLFVTHTFVLLSLVCRVLDMPLDRFRRMWIGTGSLTVVRFGADNLQLVSLNVRPGDAWGEGRFR